MNEQAQWKNVSLKAEIIERINEFMKTEKGRCYRSVAEFLSEAARIRLEELEAKEV